MDNNIFHPKDMKMLKVPKQIKITPMPHKRLGSTGICDELLAMKKKALEIIVIDVDSAKQKLMKDDDGLILTEVEHDLTVIVKKVNLFLYGDENGEKDSGTKSE